MLAAKWPLPFLHILLSNAVFQSLGDKQHFQLSTRAPPAAAPKLVFAHFIAGLTIDYTRDDWKNQIGLAASHGIDAFALNVGAPDNWQVDQVATAYDVASQITRTNGQPFQLFLSLDMSVIKTATEVSSWVTKFAPMKSQLLIGGKAFVSTFAGESNSFGANNASIGWQAAVKAPLAALSPPMDATFVPVWSSLNPSTAVSTNPVVDGIMTWKAWPTGNETTSTSTDLQFQADAKKNGKLYMASVSPCFYTHYSDKNFMFKSDNNLYINRWEELIAMPIQPDFIQIVSWNDYGESHYIGPIAGSPPAGTSWISGFDHQAWLDMTDYFIKWYKTGSPPAITEDKVYYNYRPHAAAAVATADPFGPPANATVSKDAVYAAVFLTSDSTAQQLRITIGAASQIFNHLKPGSISTFSAPWSGNGGDVRVELLDGSGKPLLSGTGQRPISNAIQAYNFNYASEVLMKGGGGSGPGYNSVSSQSYAKSDSSNIEILPFSRMSALAGMVALSLCSF
ncbi:hypothetical protein PGT21_035773 [Puccinia graminis f. sp. tritici]|uniref:Glycoside hydrolase family 71 protein n=2 Tax=Puccinia graminis f. sp. tritici TaxID=56615 RepID=E3JRN9_PUCGT|nr:uncharacterized protein PGTG_00156 [Puccinia graminis f. sp. tritici CRL 75-36-700-3]EFP74200.2 hypothetical protein PGTG_00156 [Puccinia graminis f. sp. tritici CRL 75-36-700-3]KAA1115372.1 hypothetical protein PGT21_035773 [Puccinia graminis f. sp. tritici]